MERKEVEELIYGADYYPEHWSMDRWAEDARLMREAGINTVRLAEFAWTQMEPRDGEYEFGWLDQAIEVLAAEGVKVVLCTPSATPPKWLFDQLDNPYLVDEFGRPRAYGSRRHVCASHEGMRGASRRMAREMARHYRDNPNVIGWQIDNEFGCHVTVRCYCERCRKKFIDWLELKYVSLEALNQAWGTVFWSETFTAWDQIVLPGYSALWYDDATRGHSPGMLLDFYRFSSDNWVSFQDEQVREIRKVDARPITHNFMGSYAELNTFDLVKNLDFASWDNYPGPANESGQWHVASLAHDTVRGLKNKPFWVMEQQSGPCGKSAFGATPHPGHIRLWAWQAVAHGADAIMYFRWRACLYGAEQYWHGLLGHDGIPGRRYHEAAQTGQEMQKAAERIEGSDVVAQIGMIKDFDNDWSNTFHIHAQGLSNHLVLDQYYQAFMANHYTTDVVSIRGNLDKHNLLVMPMFNVVSNEQAAKVGAYVENGGTLVLTFRSGTRNVDNSMREEVMPGPFAPICGVAVRDFDALSARKVGVASVSGAPVSFEGQAVLWADILSLESAETVAVYTEGWYKDKPAIAVNRYGKGKVYYVGCAMEPQDLAKFVAGVAAEAGVAPAIGKADKDVEAVWREKNGQRTLFLMNHNTENAAQAEITGSMTDMLTGETFKGKVGLPPLGVRVLY